jgi:serine/threonine protein kinase/lipopolysaccharide biosynthesis regulator YciM
VDEESIFAAALRKASPAERRAFLAEACAGDAELRACVEALLLAHENPDSFLEPQSAGLAPTADEQPLCERPGTAIGPYRLLEQIGEGGFGIVFMAEQQQPLRRKVALKVLKPGMDTQQVVARFEAERQALALMDHPNIARVLDAGQTDSGRPYFVMELVKGLPITDYCDQNQLTPRERLELFGDVCRAVQHAHQKGVIHRDLKPSNVLVTVQDGAPLAKVIDFGIAKALGQPLTDRTLFTGFAQLVGTPLYMSPEQAALSNVDVDTRSDVYSLGVLLYELLTGTTPFDKERIREASYDEIRRIIREEEPPRPSTRVTTLGHAAATLSTRRRSDPKRLSQLLRGELDCIVMKCLEKDRNRRYESASSLAHDLGRYLRDEPVLARPPSSWYRFRKFARRNRTGLTIGGLIALFVLLPVGALGWSAWDRAAREREADRNQAAQRAATEQHVSRALDEAAELQRQKKWPEALEVVKRAEGFATGADESLRERVGELRRDVEMVLRLEDIWLPRELQRKDGAGTDAAYAKAFQDYGIDLLSLEPAEAAERVFDRTIWLELTVALDHWAKVRTDPSRGLGNADDPIRKRLLAVARAADRDPWRNQVREAQEQGDRAALRRLAASPEAAGQPLQTLSLLARALDAAGASQEAVDVERLAVQRYPDDFEINFQLAWSLDHGQRVPQRLDEVIRFYTVARALRPRNYAVHQFLAYALRRRGLLDEAIAMYGQAITLGSETPEIGPDHPDVLHATYNLAITYRDNGQPDKAVPLLEQVLEKQKARLGADDLHTLTTLYSLGLVYLAAGRPEHAVPLFEEALGRYRERLGLDRPETLLAMRRLATAYWDMGQRNRAVSLFEQALEQHRAGLGPDHAQTLGSMCDLAQAYRDSGRPRLALPLFEQALEKMKARPGPEDPQTLLAASNLAVAYRAVGDLARALPLLEQTLEKMRARLGPNDYQTLSTANNLAVAYQAAGRPDKGVPLFEQVLEQKKVRLGPDHPGTLSTTHNLALAYREAGRLDVALSLFEQVLEKQMNRPGPDHPDTLTTLGNLARAYQAAGKLDRAEPLFRELLKCRRQKDGPESPAAALALAGLGFNLLKQEKWVAAEAALRDCLAVCISKMPDDALTCQVRSLLGGALLGQKKYAEAEPLLVQGCVGLKKHAAASREGRTRLVEALDRLVRLCEATGRKGEAQAWAARLEQAKAAEKESGPQGK